MEGIDGWLVEVFTEQVFPVLQVSFAEGEEDFGVIDW